MAQDTLLGFPVHTLPYRRRKLTTLSTVSGAAQNAPRLFQCQYRADAQPRQRAFSCSAVMTQPRVI